MEGPTESIQKALDIAVKQFGLANSIKVELENIDLPTDTSTPFITAFLLPAPVVDADLYYTDNRSGIYQLDIHYASHLGTSAINKMVDLLNAYFSPSTAFERSGVCVEVINFSPDRLDVVNGWAIKPCSITWNTYTKRL